MSASPSRFALLGCAALFSAVFPVLGCPGVALASAHEQAGGAEAPVIEGTVQTSSGEPVAGALATLTDSIGKTTCQTKTGPHGEFRFVVAHAGTYSLSVKKSGAGSSSLSSFTLDAGEEKHVKLVLPKESAAAAGIDFADNPSFTVAGVNDGTEAGGHGSDTTRRTSEALARDTLELKSNAEGKPASPSGVNAERTAAGTTHRLRGEAEERSGDPLSAVQEFELAVRADPSEENYFNWASELLLHGAPRPAVEVFSNGSKAHPSSSRMLAGLGAALYASGSPEEAARRLCQASDLNPAAPAPYLFLGKIEKSSMTPLPCAEEKLARFARRQPSNALANYYYAVSLAKQTHDLPGSAGSDQAKALLEKAVALDPTLAEAHLQLGVLFAARGDTTQAVAAYQNAIAADPALAEAHYRLGLAYKRNGENAKADHEFQLYREAQKTETAAVEARRRELRQFLVILKDQPAAAASH